MIATRQPGQPFSRPVALPGKVKTALDGPPAVAIDSQGNLVVAWQIGNDLRVVTGSAAGASTGKLSASYSSAAGRFGAASTLSADAFQPAVGVGPDGSAVVAWTVGSKQELMVSQLPAASSVG